MSRPRNATATPVREPLVQPWVPVISLVLAALGLVVSGYLTYEHFTASTTLACPNTSTWNCFTVTTSAQSRLFGIPVALLGVGYFAAMLVLSLPAAWRSRRPQLRLGRLALALGGVVFVGYLVIAELFFVDAICLWCTASHVLALVLFGVVALGTAFADPTDLRTRDL
jgi:uncharacterized membrane protein